MIENKETIVGVAIKAPDGVIASQSKPSRHHDVIRHMCDVMDYNRVPGNFVQGFITNTNRFVDRKEALVIAKEANQLIRKTPPEDILFSEDLW